MLRARQGRYMPGGGGGGQASRGAVRLRLLGRAFLPVRLVVVVEQARAQRQSKAPGARPTQLRGLGLPAAPWARGSLLLPGGGGPWAWGSLLLPGAGGSLGLGLPGAGAPWARSSLLRPFLF